MPTIFVSIEHCIHKYCLAYVGEKKKNYENDAYYLLHTLFQSYCATVTFAGRKTSFLNVNPFCNTSTISPDFLCGAGTEATASCNTGSKVVTSVISSTPYFLSNLLNDASIIAKPASQAFISGVNSCFLLSANARSISSMIGNKPLIISACADCIHNACSFSERRLKF